MRLTRHRNFAGQIKDGDGNLIVNAGLHALTFRSDGFGDANTLYFTAGIASNQDGLFGAITPGLVSTTSVSVPATPANTLPRLPSRFRGTGQSRHTDRAGNLQDGNVPIADVSLTDGVIVFPELLRVWASTKSKLNTWRRHIPAKQFPH